MTLLDAHTQAALEQIDWQEAFPKLVLYAQDKIERLRWLSKWGGAPVGGLEANDIAKQAIEDICSGKRVWNQRKPFLHFVMEDVIRSLISNAVTKKENRVTRRLQTIDGQEADNAAVRSQVPWHNDTLHHLLFTQERTHLLAFFQHDPLVYRIAALIIDEDIYEPRHLAARLGTTVTDIQNAKKRLGRLLRHRSQPRSTRDN